jgi:hypothetical protein
MRCPGQDRRYWTEDAVFEVPCPECGASIELFKDETTGRCTRCGHRFRNPGIDFGCAQWCALAERCLGLVPEGGQEPKTTEGALAGRIIQQVSEALASDPRRLRHSLKVYHFARQLVPSEGGNPRIALAAALLLDVAGGPSNTQQTDALLGPHAPKSILGEIGADEETINRVCEITRSFHTGNSIDCIEFRIVRDADTLALLSSQVLTTTPDEWTDVIENRLFTEAAKQWARKWSQSSPDQKASSKR